MHVFVFIVISEAHFKVLYTSL